MVGTVWSFHVVRHEPGRSLLLDGRAGHLAWTFRADGPAGLARWVVECNDVAMGEGRGVPSVALALALVVDALAPYLEPVAEGVRA